MITCLVFLFFEGDFTEMERLFMFSWNGHSNC